MQWKAHTQCVSPQKRVLCTQLTTQNKLQRYKKAYYKAHQQQIRATNASYYLNNKQKFTQYKRDEQHRNKAKLLDVLRKDTNKAKVNGPELPSLCRFIWNQPWASAKKQTGMALPSVSWAV